MPSPGAPASQALRLFLSSTFRDLLDAGEQRMKKVVPKIRTIGCERMEAGHHHLVLAADALRSGISSYRLTVDGVLLCRPKVIVR
jgi:hypothetical protein